MFCFRRLLVPAGRTFRSPVGLVLLRRSAATASGRAGGASEGSGRGLAPFHKKKKKFLRKAKQDRDPTSVANVLSKELRGIADELGIDNYQNTAEIVGYYRRQDHFRTVKNVEITHQLTSGQGVAVVENETEGRKLFVLVPFALKGDVVDLTISFHHFEHSDGFIDRIVRPSPQRNDSLVQCEHFGDCSGCQFQMLSYEDQLKFKSNALKTAYKQFGFDVASLPFENCVPSPLQYKYRTKLTPHFNGNKDPHQVKIGFDNVSVNGSNLINIRQCPIATDALSRAFSEEREKLVDIALSYERRGGMLLRDKSVPSLGIQGYTSEYGEVIAQKVGDYLFKFKAGEFFQVNTSILPLIIQDIQQYIDPKKHKTLVDTYCGNGLFGISLSKHVQNVLGIEISVGNVEFARINAKLNRLKNSKFILGSSEEIFKSLRSLNPAQSVVLMDPSRKGSTRDFLNQLSSFEPDLVVYVSCNVHSQARDLDYFLNSTPNGRNYQILTIKGYDFFPQTKHVESFAVLKHI